jgi:hypothetical protein
MSLIMSISPQLSAGSQLGGILSCSLRPLAESAGFDTAQVISTELTSMTTGKATQTSSCMTFIVGRDTAIVSVEILKPYYSRQLELPASSLQWGGEPLDVHGNGNIRSKFVSKK